VEVLATTPVLVGHKRVISLDQRDPYATLLANARHEYFARVGNMNQLIAKHGKHVLNQYLQAAFVGAKITNEHMWLLKGILPTLDFSKLRAAQYGQPLGQNLNLSNSDMALTLSKDMCLASTRLFGDALRLKQGMLGYAYGMADQSWTVGPVNGPSRYNDHSLSFVSPVSLVTNIRASIFTHTYTKPKTGVNPFRAHNTVLYVGNRLNRVHAHLVGASMLAEQHTTSTKQSSFVKGLCANTSARFEPSFRISAGANVQNQTHLTPANIGVNLWFTRGFKNPHHSLTKP
jgi:hypothetical protein